MNTDLYDYLEKKAKELPKEELIRWFMKVISALLDRLEKEEQDERESDASA